MRLRCNVEFDKEYSVSVHAKRLPQPARRPLPQLRNTRSTVQSCSARDTRTNEPPDRPGSSQGMRHWCKRIVNVNLVVHRQSRRPQCGSIENQRHGPSMRLPSLSDRVLKHTGLEVCHRVSLCGSGRGVHLVGSWTVLGRWLSCEGSESPFLLLPNPPHPLVKPLGPAGCVADASTR